VQLPAGELLLQRAVGDLRPRDHEQPRGVTVQPVHDPRPAGVLAAGRPPGERLGQRARPVAARRVHHDPRGLVDDDQVRVLVQHRERRRVGLGRREDRRRRRHDHRLAGRHGVTLAHPAAIDGHRSGLDQRHRLRAGADRRSDHLIQALPGLLGADPQAQADRLSHVCGSGTRTRSPR
jgi:hypothetical protein